MGGRVRLLDYFKSYGLSISPVIASRMVVGFCKPPTCPDMVIGVSDPNVISRVFWQRAGYCPALLALVETIGFW